VLAKRYAKLPSEILREGSTIDMYCLEVAIGYETYLRKQNESGQTIGHNQTEDELQEMLNSVRGDTSGG
jgi:hypothetical protein|tara:strand:- start:376 stop:582 length:207 start_codon:yes stop_codon:yes gene_type:complete